MIIKGHGISSSSNISKFNAYLFENEKNEEINTLQGSPEDIKNMFEDASNLKNGCYHFTMSSKETLTKEQALKICSEISKEYNQDPKNAVIVNHQKQRTTSDSDNNHYHIILQSADQKTGKSIDYSFSKKRNEKISRLAELENGFNLVQGRHNTAVFHQLLKEGKTEQAEHMKHLTTGDLPNSKYTSKGLEKGRKSGLDKPKETQAVKAIWQASDSLKAFKTGLSEAGYEIKPGTKPGIYIIEKNGAFVGSANRLISMKKEEFQKKYEELENVRDVQKNTKSKKIRFGSEQPEEENSPTPTTKTDSKLRKRFNNTEQKNTSEHRQNLKSLGNNRDRRKPVAIDSGRNQKQSSIDIRRDDELKREIKKLDRKLKWQSNLNKQINKYEQKKQEKLSKKLYEEISDYEIIQKIIEEFCNKLFGMPTQKQKDTVHNLIMNSHKNKELLNHIVNSELKEISHPKVITQEQCSKLSYEKKNIELNKIEKIYLSQKNFINDLNKNNNINLPNPSFREFLENHKNRNVLCRDLLVDELKKEQKDKSLKTVQKYIDNCEKSLKIPHKITDINEIKKDMSDKLFSSFKSSKDKYDKLEKDYNNISVKWYDKFFNKEKIKNKELLKNSLSEIKQEMNKREDSYDHFKHFGNEISKAESDKRIKENDEIKSDWKFKKSSEQLPVLKNILSKISINDTLLIDKINNGELKNILTDEVQKMKNEQHEKEQKKNIEQKENKNQETNVVMFKPR